jgi:hypothetical protein
MIEVNPLKSQQIVLYAVSNNHRNLEMMLVH